MRLKKQKRHRRTVRFYTTCFGFREPFKILCDGTFIHHYVSQQITASEALTSTLGAPTKLFTTRCIMAELKSLGASYTASLDEARNLTTARCEHEKRKSAAGCIADVIGEKNSEHFFIGTQDMDLRRKFQEVPGVPVIFGLRKSLLLEQPSAFQRKYVESSEEGRVEREVEMLHKRKIKLTTQVSADAADTNEGLEDKVLMPEDLMKTRAPRRVLNVKDKPQFKRKRPKGPNPLSCKKKKNPSLPPNKDGDKVSERKNRKRKRSRKGVKVGEDD